MSIKCKNCGLTLTSKQQSLGYDFCSGDCYNQFQKEEKINQWLNNPISENGKKKLSVYIRQYLFEKNNNKCELCGWGEVNQFTNKIPLEIHHIDGNHLNNSPDNLQVLCPNCHSLTNSFRKIKNELTEEEKKEKRKTGTCVDCGSPIGPNATRCKKCEGQRRKTEKAISREELKQLIRTETFVSIGKKFNCSDNNIRKWCVSYGLPFRKKDINSYSDEEWEKI